MDAGFRRFRQPKPLPASSGPYKKEPARGRWPDRLPADAVQPEPPPIKKERDKKGPHPVSASDFRRNLRPPGKIYWRTFDMGTKNFYTKEISKFVLLAFCWRLIKMNFMAKGRNMHPFTGKGTAVNRNSVLDGVKGVPVIGKWRVTGGKDLSREQVLRMREKGAMVSVVGVNGVDDGHPVAPADRYYVELVGQGFITETEGGLFVPWEFNPGEMAQVTGVVRSVPRRGGHDGIVPGMEIAFSYLAVYDEDVIGADDGEVFYEDAVTVPGIQTWSNGKGHILERKYMNNDRWRGRKYVDDMVVDMMEGTFGQFESWLEKNKFRERAGRKLNNVLDWGGRKYLSVDRQFVYGFKRQDRGEFECVAPFYFCAAPVHQTGEVEVGSESGLVGVKFEVEKRGWLRVLTGHAGGAVREGMEVYVELNKCPEYRIDGVSVMVVEEDQICGVRTPEAGAAAVDIVSGVKSGENFLTE